MPNTSSRPSRSSKRPAPMPHQTRLAVGLYTSLPITSSSAIRLLLSRAAGSLRNTMLGT